MSVENGLKSTIVHTCDGLGKDEAINDLIRSARCLESQVIMQAKLEVQQMIRDGQYSASMENVIYHVATRMVPASLWAWQVQFAYGGECHFFITRYLGA